MSALDHIISEINRMAHEKAAQLLAHANEQAIEIKQQGAQERDAFELQIEQKTSTQCGEIESRAQSANRQQRRLALLETRNEVIDLAITEARVRILNMPSEAYFDLLFRLFAQNAQPLDGVLRFGAADIANIPSNFLVRCKQVHPEHALTLSGDTEAGHDGNILQNCLLDEIFHSLLPILRDKANEVLQ